MAKSKALTAITTLAKKLYKSGKYSKWTDAIKAASTQLNKGTKNPVKGWRKGKTNFIEKGEEKKQGKNIRVTRNKPGTLFKPGTFSNFEVEKKINGLAGYFDVSVINDLDQLKKQYHKLALKYHPDKGGTKEQFQQLQKEYEKIMKDLVNGSKLSDEQKANEIKIDEALKGALDAIISIPGINIEIVGKWIWVSGNTYPIRNELKAAKFQFAPKKKMWYYAGTESTGRGNMDIEEIRAKYGSEKVMAKNEKKYLSGVDQKLSPALKRKLKANLIKLTKAINKRPI